MDLVYECFVKLGLRYICVTREGRFAGIVSTHPPLASSYHSLTFPVPSSHDNRYLIKQNRRTRKHL